MKKLILSILSIAFVFAAIGQNLKGYNVEALQKLEAKRAFVIDLDTFYATTQLSGIDTILATKEYVKSVDSEKVTGPASSTDNAIAVYDGTTGRLIQNSGVTTSDAGAIVTPSTIQATTGLFTNLTNGYLPYHVSDASGLANSNVFYNGTNIGIGTNSPSSLIHLLNNSGGTRLTIESTGSVVGSRADMIIKSQFADAAFRLNSESSLKINYIQSSNYAISGNRPLYITGANGSQGSLLKVDFSQLWVTGNTLLKTSTDNLTDALQVNGSILGTTAKLTNLSDNYLAIHQSDVAGLVNSNVFQTSNALRYNTTPTFSNGNDIVNKTYVDAIAAGNMPKLPVDAATTTNITLSGTQTIDGYSVTAGMRVLVKNQTTTSQNGVYVVASGAWSRATDLDTWAELYKAYVAVLNGAQSGSSFVCTIASTGTLGTDPITWVLYSAATNIIVNVPLSKTGNTISLNYDTNTLDVASGNLKVKDNVYQPLSTILTNTTASFTTSLETKLNGIADGAEVNVNADWDASYGDAQILNKPTALSAFTNDANYITNAQETDKVFAADSANILHWSDTLNTIKGIATAYDLTTGLATKQNTLTTGNLTENITGLQFDNTRQVIGGAAQLSLTSGYVIPTTTEQSNWNTAYTDRLKWDGGATGLVAATGRTSLGGTTIGQSVFTSTNPSAIRFLRANADNTVSWLDASAFRTAIGAGVGGGSVTSVAMTVPTGLTVTGSPITTSGTLALSLTSGYSIPTTANQTNWTAGYNDKINSLAFTGTATKILTLTQQDGGTVSNTFTDLDVQTLTADSTTTTIGLTASGSNSRVHFNVDKSATNELNNSVSWNDGTNVLTVNDAGGNKTATITGFLETEVDGSTTNELQTISTTGAAGNISLSNGGGTLNLNVNDADASITNEIQTLVKDSTAITNGKRYGISISSGNRITVTDTDSYLGSSWSGTTNNSSNWNTAYGWGNHATAGYQTGSESYISNLSLSGNTLTSTGVGSAFNSTVGNIANITSANIFTQDQTIAKASGVSALKIKDSGVNIFGSLDADNGYFYVRNGKPYFVNGDFGSSEIDLTPVSVSYPSAGIAVSTGSAWGTSITDNSANWNTAYNDKINSLAVTGTTTKTISLTQQDGGTVTGNFTDNDTYTSLVSNGGLGASGSSLYLSNINASGTAPLLTDYMWAAPSSSTTVKSFTLQTLKDLIGTSSYTLPLAANGTRGGIQIGYTSTANNFALQLSSEKAYTALPDATTSVKGIASFNSSNFSVSSGAVSVATGGIGAMNLANSVISGQVDIGSDIVDTDEFLISDGGTLRRMDASRLKTYIGNTSGGWSSLPGYITTATISDEVRIGSTTDIGNYLLQVSGNGIVTGSLLSQVLLSTTWVAPTYGMVSSEVSTPSTPSGGSGQFYAGTDSKAHYQNDSGVDFDLTNVNEPLRTVSSTGTTQLSATDKIILVTATGVTITYPTVTSGKVYTIRNTTGSAITVPTYTVLGPSTSTTVGNYQCITVVYNGSAWYQLD